MQCGRKAAQSRLKGEWVRGSKRILAVHGTFLDEQRDGLAGGKHEASGGMFKDIGGISAYLFAAGNDPIFRGKGRRRGQKCWS